MAKNKSTSTTPVLDPEADMVGDKSGLKVFSANHSNLQYLPPTYFSFVYFDFNKVYSCASKFDCS